MNNNPYTHTQDLREAFASIISMMLGLLRAQGLRGLLHLPEIVLVVFLLRSIGKRFAALMDAHAAGTLPVPTPTPWTTPQQRQAAPAQSRATACPFARRRRPRQPVPAKPARGCSRVYARFAATRYPGSAPPHRSAASARPRSKKSVFAVSPWHVHFVTLS